MIFFPVRFLLAPLGRIREAARRITEGDFTARVAQLAREQRDLAVEKLRNRYAPKLDRLQERIRKAEQKIDKEHERRLLHTVRGAGYRLSPEA